MARVLDNLNTVALQLLVGVFVPAKFDAAARFCRFGVLANSIRSAWMDILLQHGPHAAWHEPDLWARALPQHAPISPTECARAASRAYAQSQQDWSTECSLFHASPPEYIAEDWLEEAWEDPWNWRCDPRSRLLLSTLPKLPHRLGWESTSIHTAELLSLVCALRFRRPDQWQLPSFRPQCTVFFHASRSCGLRFQISVLSVLAPGGDAQACLRGTPTRLVGLCARP